MPHQPYDSILNESYLKFFETFAITDITPAPPAKTIGKTISSPEITKNLLVYPSKFAWLAPYLLLL
jgi:hypothetical protein